MSLSEFRQSLMQQQNSRRALHGAAALRAASDLDRTAQAWAEALAAKGSLENSAEAKRGECGECISMRSAEGQAAEISAEEVVSQWYRDIDKYNFADGSGKAGNFTQLVWLGTREVGVGRAQSGSRVVVVAHYRPPGNVRGRYVANVRPVESAGSAVTKQLAAAGCRVTSSKIEREEVRGEDGRLFVVERERIRYEDEQGNEKEKIVERRQEKPELKPPPEKQQQQQKQQQATQGKVLDATESQMSQFGHEVLERHNHHRMQHGVPGLALNAELSAKAQAFATELCGKSKLYNSSATHGTERLGENIASRWSNGETDYNAIDVVDHWYNEVEKFRYNEEPSDINGIGNFTQLVWKNSKELGVGKAIHQAADGSHKVVVVCYYYPSGNVMSSFRQNVLRPGK
ncbi:hypothetical protein BOX15_Mlig021365g2 [Macrostomum lignano]|uniref:SCP domain-containing protein n=1 Tax=Macrostomum lignano TaxID=282301 RepID=A0A267FX18_9PLAT|nr:hypothetical protein BOX15_Mlig021365g2 [Macrostomum lignano]